MTKRLLYLILCSTKNSRKHNAVTNDQMTTSPDVEATGQSDSELKGVTDTPLAKQKMSVTPEKVESLTDTITPVTPGSTELALDNTNNTNESNIPAPVGHDTATTDEEEAAEALLALSNMPDMDDECNDSDDNATLMPIDGPSRSIDVNPVKVKLSMDDISQAIEQLPSESRLQVATRTTHADANINSPKTDPRPTSNPDTSPPTSPTKGKKLRFEKIMTKQQNLQMSKMWM